MFNLEGAMKNITAKAEELVEEKKHAASSLLEKQVKETGEFLAHTINEAEGKVVNAAEEAKKAAVDGFDQEVEKLADSALHEKTKHDNGGGGLLGGMNSIDHVTSNVTNQIESGDSHAGLDLGSLIGDTVRSITTPKPASAAETLVFPTPAAQSTVKQVASEAKTLVDKTAAELKPALDKAVHDKINPLAQGLAQKLQPITGDVSAHVNTALAEGVKQLNPVVDDVSSKAKTFVDDTANQVSSAVDDKLKEADELFSEKREALGEPAKSMLSKAKGLFGCKLGCCTIM